MKDHDEVERSLLMKLTSEVCSLWVTLMGVRSGGGEVYRVIALTLMTLARASAPFQERLQPVRLMELMDVWFLMPLQSTAKETKNLRSRIKILTYCMVTF